MAMPLNSGPASSEEFTPKRKTIPPMRYVFYTALAVAAILLIGTLVFSAINKDNPRKADTALGAGDTQTEQSPNNEER